MNTFSEITQEDEILTNQNYKQWKKTSPGRYDFFILKAIEWPSTSFQWRPQVIEEQNSMVHSAIISSNTLSRQSCGIHQINVRLPKNQKYDEYIKHTNKVQVVKKVQCNGEINRVRTNKQKPDLVAAIANTGDVTLMDMKSQEPLAKLVYHSMEGFGLNWNPIQNNIIATGATDKKIAIWDIDHSSSKNHAIPHFDPVYKIQHHGAPVEDVAWHKYHPNILGSASDDRMLMFWDTRFQEKKCAPLFEVIAHSNEVYSIDFSPFNEFLVASGSGDSTSSVWDMRNLTRSVYNLSNTNRKQPVIKVQWSPFDSMVLASGGYGKTVDLWDLTQQQNKKCEGSSALNTSNNAHPKHLLFSHEGHRSQILDFDWNPNMKLLMGSNQENNCLHFWEMSRKLFYSG